MTLTAEQLELRKDKITGSPVASSVSPSNGEK